MLNVHTFPVGPLDCNCVLIWTDDSKALLVDPGGDFQVIHQEIQKRRLDLTAILISHAHFDHFLALKPLQDAYPKATVYLGENDLFLFRKLKEQAMMMGIEAAQPRDPQVLINQSQDIPWPKESLVRALSTPGHSPGSTCYYIPSISLLCSGDTLFHQSVGRTDLWGGSFEQITESILSLYQLDANTRVIPGHGPETTIEFEKKYNAFVRPPKDSNLKSHFCPCSNLSASL